MIESAKNCEDAVTSAERFGLALDLYAVGEALVRQRICRDHPDLDPVEVEACLVAWLESRPGAEWGDADGRPAQWPRTPR
jgi:hypothetical protein